MSVTILQRQKAVSTLSLWAMKSNTKSAREADAGSGRALAVSSTLVRERKTGRSAALSTSKMDNALDKGISFARSRGTNLDVSRRRYFRCALEPGATLYLRQILS